MRVNFLEDDIMSLIKYLNKLLKQDFDKRLQEYNLTGQQGRILFYLNRKVNLENVVVHQNDIENHFDLSKSTVSGLVKRLEIKGLIEKEISHPYYSWKPTEKGMDILEHVHSHRAEALDKLTANLNEDEKKQIITFIKQMINNMEKEEEIYVGEN